MLYMNRECVLVNHIAVWTHRLIRPAIAGVEGSSSAGG